LFDTIMLVEKTATARYQEKLERRQRKVRPRELSMRRWSWLIIISLTIAVAFAAYRLPWFRSARMGANPRPVPKGDLEIAWLHNPTSFDSWDNFVWGVKRAEMAEDGTPSGLEVDDSAAFPHRTTAVPEIIVRCKGFEGSLRIRWYKVTDEASQESWVKALAGRNPPPVAILGGWSSDRAKELADSMRDTRWPISRPLLFLGTATADKVDPENDNASGDQGPSLISVYDQSFRFCFTNRQMADAVTDFVLSDPTLRPGPTDARTDVSSFPAYAIEWKDDPYSTDLSFKFREAFQRRTGQKSGFPRLDMEVNPVPFSTGRMNRPNPVEAEVAEHILNNLPPIGIRTVLVVPSVTAPTRRVLRSLVQGNPLVGKRVVAVTGDGLGVNTFFRDRDFAWPVRSLPIPIVMFTHADPFGWDIPGVGTMPPHGYELEQPMSGVVRSSTEDIQLFTRLARVVSAGAFQAGSKSIVRTPEALATNLRSLKSAFFDQAGNRLSGGEHIVVLRPIFPGEAPPDRPHLDALLEVYSHNPESAGWHLLHTRPLSHNVAGQPE
jgi:hypothetical protein